MSNELEPVEMTEEEIQRKFEMDCATEEYINESDDYEDVLTRIIETDEEGNEIITETDLFHQILTDERNG